MFVSREKEQEYQRMVAQARAIFSQAQAQGRAMTDAEQRDFDAAMAKAEEFHLRHQERIKPEGDRPANQSVGENRTFKIDGTETRALAPNESVRSWAQESFGPEPEDACKSIGEFVVARARGEKRAMVSNLDVDGGYLLGPSASGQFVDLARTKSAALRAGTRTIPIPAGSGNSITFTLATGDPSVAWRVETAALAESQPTFGRLEARTDSVGAYCEISEELLLGSPNAAETINRSLSEAMAAEIDRVILRGEGVLEPLGISGWSGTNTITHAAPFQYDNLLTWASIPEANNGPSPENLSLIWSPTTAEAARKLKDGQGQYLSRMLPPELERMRKFVSNRCRSDRGTGSQSELFVGDFSETALIVGANVRIEMGHNGTTFQRLMRAIRCWAMVTTVTFRPEMLVYVDEVG